MTMSGNQRETLFDVHPRTGVSIEVFFADHSLISFGKSGAGWFWQVRQRGRVPEGSAAGPFPSSYSAYRNALLAKGLGARCWLEDGNFDRLLTPVA